MHLFVGDESSSSKLATFALFGLAPPDIEQCRRIISEEKERKGISPAAVLHCRVLFAGHRRRESAFAALSESEVFDLYDRVLARIGDLRPLYAVGTVQRSRSPKIMHVPLPTDEGWRKYQLKLDIKHLQFLAYCAAATAANEVLANAALEVRLDRDSTMVDWFGGRRQASRMYEVFNQSVPDRWKTPKFSSMQDEPCLQVADIVAYLSAKVPSGADGRFRSLYQRFARHARFGTFNFADQVFHDSLKEPE